MKRALVCLALASSATAYADKADALFKKGKKLLAEKKYPEACAAFEQSDKLDPSIGAKVNVARCYQEWGKLATAYRWFSDAEQMAARAKDDRKKKIHALAEELDGNVPRLTIKLPAGASAKGLEIKLDGASVDAGSLGSEQRVDPGPHKIDYVVAGKPKTKVVPLERGGSSEITLELPAEPVAERPLDKDPPRPVKPVPAPADTGDAHPGRTRKIAGLGIAGAGVVAATVAGVITLGAKSDYDKAIKSNCNGAKDMCDAIGLKLTKDARSTANLATIITIGGAVAVAGGLVLFFTAPSGAAHADEHAYYLAPAGTGLVFGGAF